ncbi:MAG: 1,4-alpha-glucan branching protein GlgB [Candidatus Eremiobacteraeota bacterium]|nr:1,4-alpha-glucan branching protein GlgB [Candidatus Eremiobacteraeota bacterium]
MHQTPDGVVLRAFRPSADRMYAIDARNGQVALALERVHPGGVFAGELKTEPFPYRLRERTAETTDEFDDPYRFPMLLGATDAWLIAEGRHLRLWEVLGAHPRIVDGVEGTAFAVWAPNARRVSIVGPFNNWDGRIYPMRFRAECGVWELFLPGNFAGKAYKYEIAGPNGKLLPLKSDPVAFQAELRPANASVVAVPSAHVWADETWMRTRGKTVRHDSPIAIYEAHLGSWRRKGERGETMLGYRELADTLVPYVRDLGFTHIELLPVTEHPFDGSWGYQTIGMFAPTSRHGTPDDFRAFVDRAHAAGIGIILDWVPGHFPTDAHALGNFDGTHLYEHADPRKGFHYGWGTYAYNLGRLEVANFLIASALYWLKEFHVDGLRVDAVSSIIYLDYDRPAGQWLANASGGNENLDATAFLRRLNEAVYAEVPTAATIAEESTSWPMVSSPTYLGGLGFGFKWNMGWMNDTLRLFSRDPLYRGHHFNELTFSLMYAFSENYILPFSHDEVVHLKRSLIGRMPGDDEARFASLRLLYGYMYAHPGKKLLFMGSEFAQEAEWSEARSLDWHQLDDPRRRALSVLVKDLNDVYRKEPALHGCDYDWAGFEWIDCDDRERAVAAFVRRDPAGGNFAVAVMNLSGSGYERYRVGVPVGGRYREILNTDAAAYGGRNRGNFGTVTADETPAHGRPMSIELYLPPQTLLIVAPEAS